MGKKPSEELIDTVYSCAVAWECRMMDELFDYEKIAVIQPLGNYLEKEVFEACLVLTGRGLMQRLIRQPFDPCIRFKVLTPHEIVSRKCRKS